jgi:hypothetical protein
VSAERLDRPRQVDRVLAGRGSWALSRPVLSCPVPKTQTRGSRVCRIRWAARRRPERRCSGVFAARNSGRHARAWRPEPAAAGADRAAGRSGSSDAVAGEGLLDRPLTGNGPRRGDVRLASGPKRVVRRRSPRRPTNGWTVAETSATAGRSATAPHGTEASSHELTAKSIGPFVNPFLEGGGR